MTMTMLLLMILMLVPDRNMNQVQVMMQPGLRVIRYGDWTYGDQDGGEGHVGTISLPTMITMECLPHSMVFITWDSGVIANYWYDGIDSEPVCDLRVLDNSQTGTL